jgi:hypothetical protein
VKLPPLLLILIAAALGYLFGTEQGRAQRDALLDKLRNEQDTIEDALDAAEDALDAAADALGDAADSAREVTGEA